MYAYINSVLDFHLTVHKYVSRKIACPRGKPQTRSIEEQGNTDNNVTAAMG